MSNFFTSSIGKKFIMSITGLFLILFLCVHLTVNLLLLVSPEAFNAGCEFMALPVIKVIEPILALGFIIHIIWASVLTLQNQKARPTKYALRNQSQNCTWASRNMYILGALVLAFLALHICTIWYNFKFGDITDHYELVSSRLEQPVYGIIYIIAAILLGLHLSHGFWSAFQTIGFSNQIWRKRLEYVAYFFAFVFGIGFSIIPLYFMIFGA
ncbi:MAG TPA: succinate dehydrogenase cytochrome b subunit [Candidatus Odoribacter faecigallinarum]|uniref:Succinate dehydrogenase cytochrome b subunit n=1 Tax=Candidatus Odoribacter faecigallinarum TaxID=2838706 RepID=A0A9D1V102_9BACT|nr:succinate dehydrogenase cytochrome b subunit [Candidatus Odoribacter faecigallinarum]